MGAGASAQVEPQYKWDPDHKLRGPWTFLFKEKVQCACEGSKWCTRENPAKQKQPNAVAGLHSSWVGEAVLAMARPWQSNVTQYNMVRAFNEQRIGMILNLQEVGEHAGCGPGNLPHTGFTYDPETFMAGGVGYYNFAWRDMGVPNLDRMMDIVQVMDYVTRVEKRKIAVHCHAGLGRTGLAIACFFVFTGMYGTSEAAIAAVRKCRAGAVQTSKQAAFVTIFGQYLQHLRCIFTPPAAAAGSARSTSPPPEAGGGGGGGGDGAAAAAALLPQEGLVESTTTGNSVVGVYSSGLTMTVPLQQSSGPAAASPDVPTEEDLGLQQHLPWNDAFQIQPRHAREFRPRPPRTYTEALARQARLLHGPERRAFLRLHKFVKEAFFAVIAAAKAFKGPGSGKAVLHLPATLPSIPEDGAAAAPPPPSPAANGNGGGGGATAGLPPTFAAALAHVIKHQNGAHVDSAGLESMAANPDYVALTGPKVDAATVRGAASQLRSDLNAGQYKGLAHSPLVVVVMLLEGFFLGNFGQGPEPASLTPECIRVIARSYQDLFDSKPPSRPMTPNSAAAAAGGGPGGAPPPANGTSLEYARQAYEILEPLEARDFELLMVVAATLRVVALVSGPGCEDALADVVKWAGGLLVGRRLNSMPTPSEAMMAFLSYLAGRDEAYAMMVLLKRQRIAGHPKRTSPATGQVDVAAMLQAEAASLVAPPPPPPPAPAAAAAPVAVPQYVGMAVPHHHVMTPLDPYVPSPDSASSPAPGSPSPLGMLQGVLDNSGGGAAAAAAAGLYAASAGSPVGSDGGGGAAGPGPGGYLDASSPHMLPALQLAQLLAQDIQQLYRVSFREEIAKLTTVVYPPPIATGRIDVHDVWR